MSPETAREPDGPQSPPAAVDAAVADKDSAVSVDEAVADTAGVDDRASGPATDPPTSERAQPPRPDVGGVGFVPTRNPPAMPAVVSTGLSLWVGSLASGLLAAGSIVRSQPMLRDRFAAVVMREDPGTTLGTAQDAASVLVWVVVGCLALVWLIHLVLVVRTAGGHGGARWGLILLGLLGAAIVLLLQAVVSDPETSALQDLNRLALFAQALLALLGSLFLLSRPAGRWFKELRRRR